MRVSPDGIKLLKILEGEKLTAYPDPGSADGHPWTIGVGHTGPEVVPGLKITAEQSTAYLRSDLSKFEDAVTELVTVPLSQGQFNACVLLIFNIGVNAFSKSTLLKLLNAGQYDRVPEQFLRWSKNNGVEMAGLLKRRKREVQMWLSE